MAWNRLLCCFNVFPDLAGKIQSLSYYNILLMHLLLHENSCMYLRCYFTKIVIMVLFHAVLKSDWVCPICIGVK